MDTGPKPPSLSATRAVRIGMFDSGLGGLSVLRALHRELPEAALHYVADSAHAPYGERDDAYVAARAERIAAHLVDHGAEIVVVACNTATAIAVAALRDRWPALPIIGIEPGLKPAVAATRNGRIGVMATRNTLASARFAELMARQPATRRFHLQACDGLAVAIESGRVDGPDVAALVAQHAAPLREAGVDTVVLGCTHYVFAEAAIQAAFGASVVLVDTAEAVARRTAELAESHGAASDEFESACRRPAPLLQTTADPAHLRSVASAWLPFEVDVTAASGLPCAPRL